ncbi:HDIG domain-containing protein [Tersicoccus solisilvae]|uniref:HDIG domain-containing protein n=1 Tax=Tersicoccus solisilvae TaxID=1882339 RepID=A0ABQ1NIP2_9MICC|nr:HD domain-containing protein [Tersicoccus solisilvae]GGC78121.1 HDIG domain-containing protein [Tersicoccus solisilvae]
MTDPTTATATTTADASTAPDARAAAFDRDHPVRPIPAAGPVDTSPITLTPAAGEDLDPLWAAVEPLTRSRSNDVHLPISLAFAERLCDAYPAADRELVRVTILLHDVGWARVDESRILSEGFTGDWRRAGIRYEHERQGCEVAREVLPGLGHDAAFVERVTAIIDGHDTRPVAYSLEDALVRDADRLWRFDHAGIALASGWFSLDPARYTDRLAEEIMPELITDAARRMAEADLERSRALLKTGVLR